MYLMAIHVPIYVEGSRRLVASDWHRSLVLLRDSLQGRFGPMCLLAPGLPVEAADSTQVLVELHEGRDGVTGVSSFDPRGRCRDYWLRDRARWLSDLRAQVDRAEVVHAGLDDVYRPIAHDGFRMGVRRGRATVFVQDTDIALQAVELAARAPLPGRLKSGAYARIFERMCRAGVSRADLSLLKGRTLMRRYGAYARNAHSFHDTSYLADEVVAPAALAARLDSLREVRPLRLVYCGRLVARKGLADSVEILRRARALGADLELDLIGEGPERPALERQIADAGLGESIRLLGSAEYGRDLLARLASYDALLFTPTAEDTPRMIFDGYAAGLPLIATGIEYVKERDEEDGAAVVLPPRDLAGSAAVLAALAADRPRLADLSHAARAAGVHHAADSWYARRAEWTFEAVDRHRAAKGSAAVA